VQAIQSFGNFGLVGIPFEDTFVKSGGAIGPLHGLVDQCQLHEGTAVVRVEFERLLQPGLGTRQIASLVPQPAIFRIGRRQPWFPR
jgi:hypothetical protein